MRRASSAVLTAVAALVLLLAGLNGPALPAVQAQEVVLHVSASAALGGDGSAEHPYATIGEALSAAQQGSVVEVGDGTYREGTLRISTTITLRAAAGAHPVLTGADRVTRWTRQRDGTWSTAPQMVRFCDVCTVNPVPGKEAMAAYPEQLWIDGKPLTQVATAQEVTETTFYVDDPEPVRLANGTDTSQGYLPAPHTGTRYVIGADPTGREVEITQRARALTVDADDVVLSGLTVERFSPLQVWDYQDPETGGYTGAVMVSVSGERARVENMVLRESAAGTALALSGAHGSVVRGTTLEDNGAVGLGVNRSDDVLVEGSTFRGNNSAGFLTAGCGAYCTVADMKATHSQRLTYRGNLVDHSQDAQDVSLPSRAQTDAMPAAWLDEGMMGSSITTSHFLNVPVGVFVEVSADSVIASNLIEGAATGIRVSGSQDTQVWNNTVVHALTSIEIREDPRHGGCNALVGDGSCARPETWSTEHALSWDTTGTVVVNNVMAYPQQQRDPDDPWRYTPMLRVLGGANDDGSGQVWAPEMMARLDSNVYLRPEEERSPADTDVLWKGGPDKADSVNAESLEELRSFTTARGGTQEAEGLDLRGTRQEDTFFTALQVEPTSWGASDLHLSESSPGRGRGAALPDDVLAIIGQEPSDPGHPDRGALVNVAWESPEPPGSPATAGAGRVGQLWLGLVGVAGLGLVLTLGVARRRAG